MFITEQHITQDTRKNARKRFFEPGMPLANPRHVKPRFTYKELTVVLGIFVALIIVLTLWAGQRSASLTPENTRYTPRIIVPAVTAIVKKSISLIKL